MSIKENRKVEKILDLPKYGSDRYRYNNVYNDLFWWKKNKGINWIKGQNFGDYLSLVIVGEIVLRESLGVIKLKSCKKKLLAAGSILHFARNGDVVWGSGINGKVSPKRHTFTYLDIRMVRGPLTKKFLKKKGMQVNSVFGDPVLLLPILFPKLSRNPELGKVIVLPSLNDLKYCTKKNLPGLTLVSPLFYWKEVINEILSSELVLTSSLHGLIVAEAFGVPVRFIMPTGGETIFKYQDYYKGTGRVLDKIPTYFEDRMTYKSGVDMPEPFINTDAMLASFPRDLF